MEQYTLQIRKLTNENHFKKAYKEYLFKLFCETKSMFSPYAINCLYILYMCVYSFCLFVPTVCYKYLVYSCI